MDPKATLMAVAAKLWSASWMLRGAPNWRELESIANYLDLTACEFAKLAGSSYQEVCLAHQDEPGLS